MIMTETIGNLSKDVVVINELGLHARSAAKIAEIAQGALYNVWIVKESEAVDAKSIIDMLSLACARGTQITVRVDSPVDRPVLDHIVELVECGFGE